MQDTTILWADDEIDLLKPHVLFLTEKGYTVKTVTNGTDAVEAFKNTYFDLRGVGREDGEVRPGSIPSRSEVIGGAFFNPLCVHRSELFRRPPGT